MPRHPFILRLSLLAAFTLATPTLLTACGPKKPQVEELTEEQMANPVEVFRNGVAFMKAVDPKTGAIDYDSAYARFVEAAELSRSQGKPMPRAHFNAAWVAEVTGKIDKAEKHYKLAYEADPAYEKAMFSLIRVYQDEKKFDEAIALYKAFLEKNPDNEEVRNELVVALSKAGKVDEAIAEAQSMLRANPDNAAVYRSLSTLYFDQGNLAMSQLCNEIALSINDGDPGTYNNMAVAYLLQNDEESAIEKLKTARKLQPQGFEQNMNLGYIAVNSGDFGLARECFEKATEARPQDLKAKLGLAVAIRGTAESKEDYAKADAIYNEIIEADPQNDLAYFNASILHEKYTKDFRKAEKYLDMFIESHQVGPDHVVFERKARIQKSIEEEKARIAAERQRKKEEEERRKRNEALLKELATNVGTLQEKINGNTECLDPSIVEQGMMIIEQANMVIEAQEASMAGDLKTFVDDTMMMVDASLEGCGGGAPAEGSDAEGSDAEGTGAAPEGG